MTKTHEEITNEVQNHMRDLNVTDSVEDQEENTELYLVASLAAVEQALYLDIETEYPMHEEELSTWLDRHGIQYR